MALERMVVPIVVDGGINTKQDAKLVGANEALEQINADFDEVGAIKKRSGTIIYSDAIYNDLINPAALLSDDVPQHIIEHNNELITITENNKTYSYREDEQKWAKKTGDPLSAFSFVEDKYGERISTFSPDIAECPAGNFRVIGYVTNDENSTAMTTKTIVLIQDYHTNQKDIIWEQNTSLAPGGNPDLITKIQVQVYYQANPIIFVTYNVWNPVSSLFELRVRTMDKDGTLINDVLITSGTNTAPLAEYSNAGKLYYDTIMIGNKLFVATTTQSLTQIKCRYVGLDGALGTGIAYNTTSTRPTNFGNVSVAVNSSYIFVAATSNQALSDYFFFALNKADLSTALNETYLGSYTKTPGKVSIGFQTETMLIAVLGYIGAIDPYYANTTMLTDRVLLYTIDITVLAAPDVNIKSIDQASLASKILVAGGNVYFVVQSIIPLSMRYALMVVASNYSMNNIGTFSLGNASLDDLDGITEYGRRKFNQPSLQIGHNGLIYYPAQVKVRIIPTLNAYVSGAYYYVSNISLYRFELDSEYEGISAKLGANTYIAGSTVKEYDGNQIYSQSFLDVPIIGAITTSGAGAVPAGTYSYRAIFEFIDSNGQVHRSAPSVARSITTAGGTLSIPFFTTYLNETKPYSLILYRTLNGGTVYYRVGSDPYVNYLYGAESPFLDVTTDATLVHNEPLYTNGGILENELLPPSKYLIAANNRIFSLSSEDENLINYSQLYLPGECVNFSQALSMRVDAGLLNRSGKAMALSTMDGKIVVFKDQSIAAFTGDGPNQAGEQNTFSDPKLISSDVGLVDIKSIATTPSGLMFKSQKGIYQLDRSFQLNYIGAPVEAYNSEKITGTSHIISEHKILFMTSSRTLMFDYLLSKWATWEWTGRSLMTYLSLPAFISNARIYAQQIGLYKDNTTYYSLKIKTPWIKASGIQNYQRLYKIIILGTYYTAHTLTMKIYYDYDDSIVETHVISPLVTDNLYQYMVKLINQKCQAFKVELYDNVSSGTGKGYKLSNVTLLIGQKRGLNKFTDSRKYV